MASGAPVTSSLTAPQKQLPAWGGFLPFKFFALPARQSGGPNCKVPFSKKIGAPQLSIRRCRQPASVPCLGPECAAFPKRHKGATLTNFLLPHRFENIVMLFFFSYARADLSPFLKKFYGDLREAVRSKAGEADPDKVSFRDAVSIAPGRPWPEALTAALSTCKVFVYLHTPTFFTRDGCGREFRVIKNRMTPVDGAVPDLARASCIQPIYWDGEKQITNVPGEIARIQLTHEDDGEDYNRSGLLQISRASYGTQVYWNAINAIAQRIWAAAQTAPLQAIREPLRWEHIAPLFPVTIQPYATQPVAAHKPVRPPRYARFVWIVGKWDELVHTRRADSLECYDPDGIAEEWRPFLPESPDPARLLATDAAREAQLGYQCERAPQDYQELQSLVEQASDAYTPIVVVSDLWSLNLDKYQAVVRVFDRGKLDNCAVVFPWNLKDGDTYRGQPELRRMLAEVFPVQFHKPETSLVFEGVSDVVTFKAELSKLLTKYIADISRGMTAARELPTPSPFAAPPQLGPASK
jgi:FxsC-like protein